MALPTRFNQAELDAAIAQQKDLEDKINSSPNAYSDATTGKLDVQTDIALQGVKKTVDTLTSLKQKEAWYGLGTGDSTTQGKQNEGFFSKTLGAMGAPLRGVVGAVEGAIGNGVKKGVLENANYNAAKGDHTFGDVLQEVGVPKFVSMPLGFAMDIAGDPVNWATAGATALVPRIGMGLAKGAAEEGLVGALKGATSAAASSIGGDVLGAAKFIPGARGTELFKKASDAVYGQATKFNEITGIDQLANASKGIFGNERSGDNAFTLSQGLESAIAKIPGGSKLVEMFKYSPADYAEKAKYLDGTFKMLEDSGVKSSVGFDLSRISNMVDNPLDKKLWQTAQTDSHLLKMENELKKVINDAENVAQTGTRGSFLMADGANEFEQRLAQEALKDQELRDSIKFFSKLNSDKTGIDLYDAMRAKVKDNIAKIKIGDIEVGNKIMDTIGGLNSLFKFSKVIGNPASYTNSFASNTVFNSLYGFDPFDTFMGNKGSTYLDVYNFLKGKKGADFVLKNFFDSASDFSKYAAKNPEYFKSTYGLKGSMIGGQYFIDEVIKTGKSLGLVLTAQDERALLERMSEMPNELRSILEKAQKGQASGSELMQTVASSVKNNKILKQSTPLEQAHQSIMAGAPGDFQHQTSLLTNEFSASEIQSYYKAKEEIAARAASGDVFAKIQDTILNKAVGKLQNEFELLDQTAKLTTTLKMVNRGLTESELKAISRNIKGGINKSDVVWQGNVEGQQRYRLTWDKATDIANDVYMNYAAMPAFVRMMRSAPLVGMPFGSFAYAAGIKTAKNFLNNPAQYNKLNFFLDEISGQKTPIEKEALKSKYYSWFNSPGMVKLPFMIDHPLYINMTNWIPHLGLNIYAPSERKYAETPLGSLATAADKLGLFGTPTGQILWDYAIVPHLMSTGQVPMGKFGQALYPKKATALDKAGYAARSYAESLVPTALAPLGMLVPEKYAKYIPLSQARKFSEGLAGKNQLGINKVGYDPVDITALNAASALGVSVNPLDLTTLTNTIKKSSK